MSDNEVPEDAWMAWIDARYAIADLRCAEARLELSPAATEELRAAINRAAHEVAARLNQLHQSQWRRSG